LTVIATSQQVPQWSIHAVLFGEIIRINYKSSLALAARKELDSLKSEWLNLARELTSLKYVICLA
jgi:hypothetical protein